MKLCIVSSHVFDKSDEELNSITTGLAITLYDIISNFYNDIDTSFFATVQRVKGKKNNFFAIEDTSTKGVLKNMNLDILLEGIKEIRNTKNVKRGVKKIYRLCNFESFKIALRSNRYDIVNVHDLSETNLKIINYCQDKDIPCLVTLHIYIGHQELDSNMQSYAGLQRLEDDFFEWYKGSLSVISSGMKKRIMQDHNLNEENVDVILDGTWVSHQRDEGLNLYDNLFDAKRKTLLCIGTIIPRKNQLQIVRALQIIKAQKGTLPEVIFVGSDSSKGLFEKKIQDSGLGEYVKYIGAVKSTDMCELYRKSYGVISVSLNEAFGLIFIEGFTYGKPAIYFYDIDAAEDLFSEKAVIKISDHSDEAVADAIIRAVSNTWNKELIKKHAAKFDVRETASGYKRKYKEILEQHEWKKDSCKQ